MKTIKNERPFLILFLAVLLGLFNSGCSESDDEANSVNTANSISISDFQVVPTSIPVTEIIEEINDETSFYDNFSETRADAEVNCIDNTFDSTSVVALDDGFFELSMPDTDISGCFSNYLYDEFTYVESFYVKFQMLDQYGNVINASGMHFSELENIDAAEEKYLMKVYLKLHMRNGVYTADINSKMMMSSGSNPDMPCHDISQLVNDCSDRYVSNEVYSDLSIPVSENETWLTVLLFNNIQESDDGIFFTVGNIGFTIQDWSGTMSYNASDSSAAPTYSATNGSLSVTGTFIGPSRSVVPAARAISFSDDNSSNIFKLIKTRLKKLH